MYGRDRPGPLVAALTALAFGCATVRVPASELREPSPLALGAVAAPEIELWVESGKEVSPAEAELALAETHAALRSSLEGRDLGGQDAPHVLYVRERAVVRTASRRTNQTLAAAGIVVAAVAVVAVVVLAVVGGKGGGGKVGGSAPRVGSPSAAPARLAPTAVPAPSRLAPAAVPAPARFAPAAAPAPSRLAPASRQVPSGGWGSGWGSGGTSPSVDAWIDAAVEPPVPGEPPAGVWAGAPGQDPWASPPAARAWTGTPGGGATGLPAPALPPAAGLDVSRRGFFAGDAFVLDLVLVERRTGRPIWSKVVKRDADPRDARAVAEGIDEALGAR